MNKITLSRDFSVGNFVPNVLAVKSAWIEFFVLYFNFGFFTLCIPFRFHLDRNSQSYVIKRNVVQKVLCGLLYLGTWVCIITNFRKMKEKDFQKDPLLYIVLASVTLDSIYLLWVFEFFWRRSHLFVEFFDELQTTMLLQFCTGTLQRARLLIGSLCLMSLVQAGITVMYKIEKDYWTEGKQWEAMVKDAKYMFMIEDSVMMDDGFRSGLAYLCVVINFTYQLLKNLSDLIGLTSVIMLRHVVNDLLHAMKDKDFSPALMQTSYDALRDLMEKLNFAVGIFIFFIFLGPVPYYSINIVDMLDDPDFLGLTSNCVYLTTYFATIIFAARINKKGFKLKHWLEEEGRYEKIPEPKLLMLLHDISYDEIGISGSGYFTATSGLVGTVVSLILTYAIIVVQFRASDAEKNGNMTASEINMYDPSQSAWNFTARRVLAGATYKYMF